MRSHQALNAIFVCLQLSHMIGRAGDIPHLYAGLVPILEHDMRFSMRTREGVGQTQTSPIAKYFPSADRHIHDIGFL